MNLEELRKLPPAIEQFDWRGGRVWLRKLSAKDHVELLGRITDESGKALDTETDRLSTIQFHIELGSRSLCNEQGVLLSAGEDVKSFLKDEIAFEELVDLGIKVLAISGYDTGEKKTDSQINSDSPTSSV